MNPIRPGALAAMRRWGDRICWLREISRVYIKMATQPSAYRPGAPSDGLGYILLNDAEIADPIRLEIESWEAARRFWEADDRMSFHIIGCIDSRLAATAYLTLHAAQLCCSGLAGGQIRKILKMAIAELPDGE